MLRALSVEGLRVAEYTEPLPGDDTLIRTPRGKNLARGERISRLAVPGRHWELTHCGITRRTWKAQDVENEGYRRN